MCHQMDKQDLNVINDGKDVKDNDIFQGLVDALDNTEK